MFSDVTFLFKNKIGYCIGSACTVLMNSQKCLNVFGSNIPAKCGLLSDTLMWIYAYRRLQIKAYFET